MPQDADAPVNTTPELAPVDLITQPTLPLPLPTPRTTVCALLPHMVLKSKDYNRIYKCTLPRMCVINTQ
jgi:hypothetical protein